MRPLPLPRGFPWFFVKTPRPLTWTDAPLLHVTTSLKVLFQLTLGVIFFTYPIENNNADQNFNIVQCCTTCRKMTQLRTSVHWVGLRDSSYDNILRGGREFYISNRDKEIFYYRLKFYLKRLLLLIHVTLSSLMFNFLFKSSIFVTMENRNSLCVFPVYVVFFFLTNPHAKWTVGVYATMLVCNCKYLSNLKTNIQLIISY